MRPLFDLPPEVEVVGKPPPRVAPMPVPPSKPLPGIQPRARAFFKWAGGKKRSLAHIVRAVHSAAPDGFGTYFEPFAGSAAVFFALVNEGAITRAELSDIDQVPMIALEACRADPTGFAQRYRAHHEFTRHHSPEENNAYWYEVHANIRHAADWAWLKQSSYMGSGETSTFSSRTSASGGVPLGAAAIPAAGRALAAARVFVRDYRAIEPQAGDLVYADPPYFGTKNSTVYQRGEENAGGGWHTELHAKLMEWNARGAAVVTSNVNTPFIRELYAGWGAVEYSLHWGLGNKGRQNRGYEVALWRRGLPERNKAE